MMLSDVWRLSVWRLSRTSGRRAACAAGWLDGAYWPGSRLPLRASVAGLGEGISWRLPAYSLLLLHCALSCAVYCNRPCLCVCLFVGPPYYSQRAVFMSSLSTFFINIINNNNNIIIIILSSGCHGQIQHCRDKVKVKVRTPDISPLRETPPQ